MALEIFEGEQSGDVWRRLHLGMPTASEFQCLMANGSGEGRKSYARRKAAEIITDEPGESFSTPAMERGKLMEARARNAYSLVRNVEPRLVSFCRDLDLGAGCSPDSLIDNDGVLEMKTQRADLLIATIENDKFPPEHYAQCQGALLVTGRAWIDFVAFWPGMPLFIKNMRRDVAYLAEMRKRIAAFNKDVAAMVERIKRYGK